MSPNTTFLFLLWIPATFVSSFTLTSPLSSQQQHLPALSRTALLAAKKKKGAKKNTGSGGGFGSSPTSKTLSSPAIISADKTSLEKQWDLFAYFTDLEITPIGNPEDEDYQHFEVADLFVRCRKTDNNEGTKWFRIGKACITDDCPSMATALTLQKGLIFWTAVHMRRELVAAGGRSGAAALELGYTPASMYTGAESDPPLDEEESDMIQIAEKVSIESAQPKSFGFRPDWNPPGFTYKRREKAAMKKKRSSLEEMTES